MQPNANNKRNRGFCFILFLNANDFHIKVWLLKKKQIPHPKLYGKLENKNLKLKKFYCYFRYCKF